MHISDPVIGGYSGGETSGLESSFTSPSVHHKDFIEQYLNKLSYLPGDVITNSEPMFSSAPPPHTTSYMPYTSSAGGGLVGTTSMDDFLAKQDMIYNQMADPIGLYDHTSVSLTGGIGGGGTKVVDMLEIPGKGRCCVYFARYSYDPLQQSLNDNPESELYLTAGDYVLAWGDPDEDGYLEGEMLDGRKGLLPINFCERLEGDDLLEFHQSVVLGFASEEEVWSTMVPTDLPMDLGGRDTLPTSPVEDPMPYSNPCNYLRLNFRALFDLQNNQLKSVVAAKWAF